MPSVLRQELKRIYSLVIGYRNILRPADIVEMSMLRAYSGIVQSCGDRINGSYLSVLILAEIRLHTVENADLSRVYGRSSLKCVDPAACRLTADKSYAIIGNVVVKASDSVRAAAYARKNRIGKSCPLFRVSELSISREITA